LQIIVCGIGQWFRGDDAIGLAVVERWAQSREVDSGIEPRLITSPASQLPDAIQSADCLLLVDAISSGQAAGHITVVHDFERLEGNALSPSSHGLGLAEIIRMMQNLPLFGTKRLSLIGIELHQSRMGESLSPDVARKIPEALETIDAEIRNFRSAG
jgi:hydrogenase maturation protease